MFPRVWVAMKVQHRYHEHQGLLEKEEDAIGENSNECSMNAALDFGKLERIFKGAAEREIHFGLEPEPKVSTLSLVVERGIKDLDLRFLSEFESSHRCAACRRDRRSWRASSHERLEP